MMKIILLAFNCLFMVGLHGISFGFKTCTSWRSTTSEAVTLTIYEDNKMFQCVIPSASEAGKVYKCSDRPRGDDFVAFECRSADHDKYGMLITVPPSDDPGKFGTDDVCVDALIVNGPTEYDTKNAYIGDGIGIFLQHSRYYEFSGAKPSDSNAGPFANAVVYEGIPTCFEECDPRPPPPPPPPLCTATGKGPAQKDMDAGTQYCKDNGCVLAAMHCNYGSLAIDADGNEIFQENPLPCTPTCDVTVPEGGPFITAVAAHKAPSFGVDNGDEDKYISLMSKMNNLENITFYGFGVMVAIMVTMAITIICLWSKKTYQQYKKAHDMDSDV